MTKRSCTGESASLVTEEYGCRAVATQGRTIHLDEGSRYAVFVFFSSYMRRASMDLPAPVGSTKRIAA